MPVCFVSPTILWILVIFFFCGKGSAFQEADVAVSPEQHTPNNPVHHEDGYRWPSPPLLNLIYTEDVMSAYDIDYTERTKGT
jgi:hypothetical protein